MNPDLLFIDAAKLIAENDTLKAANIALKAKINDVPFHKIVKYLAIGATITVAGVIIYYNIQERKKNTL